MLDKLIYPWIMVLLPKNKSDHQLQAHKDLFLRHNRPYHQFLVKYQMSQLILQINFNRYKMHQTKQRHLTTDAIQPILNIKPITLIVLNLKSLVLTIKLLLMLVMLLQPLINIFDHNYKNASCFNARYVQKIIIYVYLIKHISINHFFFIPLYHLLFLYLFIIIFR